MHGPDPELPVAPVEHTSQVVVGGVPVDLGTPTAVRLLQPATRYDKLAVRYEATVLVAAVNEWL